MLIYRWIHSKCSKVKIQGRYVQITFFNFQNSPIGHSVNIYIRQNRAQLTLVEENTADCI